MIYLYRGQLDRAESAFSRAVAIDQKALGAEHPFLPAENSALGLVYAYRHQFDKAISQEERVLALCEKRPCEKLPVTMAWFGLARALWESHRDPKRALELARRAERELENSDSQFARWLRTEIQRWLADRNSQEMGSTPQSRPLYHR